MSSKPLSTHDERQSAYRGPGPDTDITGHGRDDPSAPLPDAGRGEGLHPRGHGKGGHLGEGEPDYRPQRDGGTRPDFGQGDRDGQASGTTSQSPGRSAGGLNGRDADTGSSDGRDGQRR